MIYDFMNVIFGCKVYKVREKWVCKYYIMYYFKIIDVVFVICF